MKATPGPGLPCKMPRPMPRHAMPCHAYARYPYSVSGPKKQAKRVSLLHADNQLLPRGEGEERNKIKTRAVPWLLAGGAHCLTAQALVWRQRERERVRSQRLSAFGLLLPFRERVTEMMKCPSPTNLVFCQHFTVEAQPTWFMSAQLARPGEEIQWRSGQNRGLGKERDGSAMTASRYIGLVHSWKHEKEYFLQGSSCNRAPAPHRRYGYTVSTPNQGNFYPTRRTAEIEDGERERVRSTHYAAEKDTYLEPGAPFLLPVRIAPSVLTLGSPEHLVFVPVSIFASSLRLALLLVSCCASALTVVAPTRVFLRYHGEQGSLASRGALYPTNSSIRPPIHAYMNGDGRLADEPRRCFQSTLLLPPPEPLLKRSAWREPLFYLLPTCHSAAILSACFRCNPIQNAAVACFAKDFLFTFIGAGAALEGEIAFRRKREKNRESGCFCKLGSRYPFTREERGGKKLARLPNLLHTLSFAFSSLLPPILAYCCKALPSLHSDEGCTSRLTLTTRTGVGSSCGTNRSSNVNEGSHYTEASMPMVLGDYNFAQPDSTHMLLLSMCDCPTQDAERQSYCLVHSIPWFLEQLGRAAGDDDPGVSHFSLPCSSFREGNGNSDPLPIVTPPRVAEPVPSRSHCFASKISSQLSFGDSLSGKEKGVTKISVHLLLICGIGAITPDTRIEAARSSMFRQEPIHGMQPAISQFIFEASTHVFAFCTLPEPTFRVPFGQFVGGNQINGSVKFTQPGNLVLPQNREVLRAVAHSGTGTRQPLTVNRLSTTLQCNVEPAGSRKV
ncbi:uncharacterized protein CLUP02_01502 [Colletotrichum lupini]|uniref:Uncharacterized protein n=1 Tax=Colletotrichum lupini TaxID=145971 RepID=A0A9Q8SCU1_9PEZI|nr:uncharacterized protein CLUP02_01502 [Colletotrichum lupini]UQC74850.1 hypothetical protein CLUP02_01502 [Colletotrichum lupini]